jgi:hypothetical protein
MRSVLAATFFSSSARTALFALAPCHVEAIGFFLPISDPELARRLANRSRSGITHRRKNVAHELGVPVIAKFDVLGPCFNWKSGNKRKTCLGARLSLSVGQSAIGKQKMEVKVPLGARIRRQGALPSAKSSSACALFLTSWARRTDMFNAMKTIKLVFKKICGRGLVSVRNRNAPGGRLFRLPSIQILG